MKIGINLEKYSYNDRGIAIYTRQILDEFKTIARDCEFIFFGHFRGKYPTELQWPNATFCELPGPASGTPIQSLCLEQLAYPLQQRRLKLDAMWHPHNRNQWFTPVSYVSTMHDILSLAQPWLATSYLNSWVKRLLYFSRTKTAGHSSLIIAISEFTRQELIKYLRVAADKVVTVHNGIDQNVYRVKKDELAFERVRKSYALPSRYMLTTGSYAPHKNLKTLLSAYSLSKLPGMGIGVVVVGPTNTTGYKLGFKQLQEYSKSLEVTAHIRLLESVPREDLVLLYNYAELFSTASLYEGFGLTPLEAMACGVPVVVSSAGAIPEVCDDFALYSDPLDARSFALNFNRIVHDRVLRQKLVKGGLSRAGKFTWQDTAAKTLEVLRLAAGK